MKKAALTGLAALVLASGVYAQEIKDATQKPKTELNFNLRWPHGFHGRIWDKDLLFIIAGNLYSEVKMPLIGIVAVQPNAWLGYKWNKKSLELDLGVKISRQVNDWLEAGVGLDAFAIKKGDTPYYSLSPGVRIQLIKDVLGVSIGTDFRDIKKYKLGASYFTPLGKEWNMKIRATLRDSIRLGRAAEASLVLSKGKFYIHGKAMQALDYVPGDPEKHRLTGLLEIGVRWQVEKAPKKLKDYDKMKNYEKRVNR
nr:hypothetical protein [Nanoarchaeota archaeon]